MSSLLDTLTRPFTQLFAGTASLFSDPHTAHLLPPDAPVPDAMQKMILHRFLQNFEHVELNPLMDVDYTGLDRPTKTHPHMQFRLCSKDSAAMTQDDRIAYLSRQVDRGVFLLKRFNLDITDIHIDKEKGALLYDVAFKEGSPEIAQSEHALKQIASYLQDECKQARAERKEKLAAIA